MVVGTQLHTLLNQVLTKRNKEENIKGEQQQVLKFVEKIEDKFQCKIMWGEKNISGFAGNNEQMTHFWNGRFDCVGLMNKTDKTNSGVIVIDWRTCDNVTKFWNNAGEYKEKLHQCIIYRRLLAIQMREYFNDQEIPEPGIMIVAIDRRNINVNDPRLCLDFTKLERAGIFDKMDGFDWKPCLSSQIRSGRRRTVEAVKVCL